MAERRPKIVNSDHSGPRGAVFDAPAVRTHERATEKRANETAIYVREY